MKNIEIVESPYLTDESEIVNYFMDVGREYFDCGQGYYQDEVDVVCKIGDQLYKVHLVAEIVSAKQDIGERLYWVDSITDVTYKKIQLSEEEVRVKNREEEIDYIYKLLKEVVSRQGYVVAKETRDWNFKGFTIPLNHDDGFDAESVFVKKNNLIIRLEWE